jgi:hypothetical protein
MELFELIWIHYDTSAASLQRFTPLARSLGWLLPHFQTDMGATSSSEWRSLCCCCCVDSKRRAVEIGDGSLGERLLDESDKGDTSGGGGGAEVDGKPSKTVVTDAWLLQVEETRRAASDRASRESSDGGEDKEEERDEELRTAWDLSEEDADEEEEAHGPGEDGDGPDAALDASGERDDERSVKDSVRETDGSGSWQRSDRFSSRSARDSYASATDRASGSMLFRESSEGGTHNINSTADADDDEDLEEYR